MRFDGSFQPFAQKMTYYVDIALEWNRDHYIHIDHCSDPYAYGHRVSFKGGGG